MSEYTAIVSASYKILGVAEDFMGTFSITVNEDTTAGELHQKIAEGAESLQSVADEFGMALVKHLSKMMENPEEW